jgi:hypothetical protein
MRTLENKRYGNSIQLHPSLSFNEEISKLAILFFNSSQPEKLQEIVSKGT